MTGVVNGSKCFVAGTIVLTEDGEKPIEDIEVGDYVYASDPETGETGYKEVVQTFENETEELVHIYVNGDEIVSTPTHPFYSPHRGWTSAVDLKAGDILVLSNGDYVIVEQVQHEILEAPVKVYNFEVRDFHTYYVGKNSVLVHNYCETKDLYRAVGVEEYEDIMKYHVFRGAEDGTSLLSKEFGNSFEETLEFANSRINSDKVAIIKVTIPDDVYKKLNHMDLDPFIFKSGTPVVEPDMLKLFNDSIRGIEHVF